MYTKRVFIDLEKYGDREEALEVMTRKFSRMKEFEGREGTRLFFLLESEYHRLNFIVSITALLKSQGYLTQIVDEIDVKELKKLQKQQNKRDRIYERFNGKTKLAQKTRKGRAF